MKRGFTLLELIVVVIILGILATLGFTQYTKMVEKGRTAEAKMILGQIRTAQNAYFQQYGAYATDISLLSVSAATDCGATNTNFYFSYASPGDTSTATRCTANGKPPVGPAAYTITLVASTGTWGGSPGYY